MINDQIRVKPNVSECEINRKIRKKVILKVVKSVIYNGTK